MSEATLPPETEEVPLGNQEGIDAGEDTTPIASEEQTDEEVAPEPAGEVLGEKKPNGFQRRVEKFKNTVAEKDREIEYLRSIAFGNQKADVPTVTVGKPKLADFDSVEEYVEAREQHLKKDLLQQMQQETVQKQRETTVLSAYEQKVSEAKKSLPDWDDVFAVADDVPTARDTVEFCLESDIGPKIAYHLAKHPEEHEQLNKLSPIRRVAALSKLEDRLNPPVTRKTTNAPAKLSDVKGNGTPVTKTSGEARSYTEWLALQKPVAKR